MPSMEERMRQLELGHAGMRVEMNNLINATQDNTDAVRTLTNALSYNKGAVWASARWAALVTMLVGAAWAVGTWVVSLVHGAPR